MLEVDVTAIVLWLGGRGGHRCCTYATVANWMDN